MTNLEVLRGALADIAFSDDMTLEIARAKAKRVYESTADEPAVPKECDHSAVMTAASKDYRRTWCAHCGETLPHEALERTWRGSAEPTVINERSDTPVTVEELRAAAADRSGDSSWYQHLLGLAADALQRRSASEPSSPWSKLLGDCIAQPCKYPCLRDDLGDWMKDNGLRWPDEQPVNRTADK